MSVSVNDQVRVDGCVATVVSKFAAGKHIRYVLSDGREVLDLDKLVANGTASISVPVVSSPRVTTQIKDEDDDDEEAEEDIANVDL